MAGSNVHQSSPRSSTPTSFETTHSLDVRRPSGVELGQREVTYSLESSEKGVEAYEVSFDPDEPTNPRNWSRARRWYLTGLASLLVLNA